MKGIKIAYWIVTMLFALFTLFGAVQEIMQTKGAVDIITNLHYPAYFVPFIGVCKILGVIGILVPGFPRIKEWAYAGFVFDLAGATYSTIAIGEPASHYLLMLPFFAIVFASYILYHLKEKQTLASA